MKKAPQPTKLDWRSRILIAAIGVPFLVLGALAIITERHSGSTRRGLIYMEGDPAVAMGFVLVVLGLLPMAALMPDSRALKAWLVVWALGFAASLWALFNI